MDKNQTPQFIKSKTELGLQRAMLQNNMRRNSWHEYSIIWNGKEYVAWFIAGEVKDDISTDQD